MNSRRFDVVVVNPDSSAKAYQGLADTDSAGWFPTTLAILVVQGCRANGLGVGRLGRVEAS